MELDELIKIMDDRIDQLDQYCQELEKEIETKKGLEKMRLIDERYQKETEMRSKTAQLQRYKELSKRQGEEKNKAIKSAKENLDDMVKVLKKTRVTDDYHKDLREGIIKRHNKGKYKEGEKVKDFELSKMLISKYHMKVEK